MGERTRMDNRQLATMMYRAVEVLARHADCGDGCAFTMAEAWQMARRDLYLSEADMPAIASARAHQQGELGTMTWSLDGGRRLVHLSVTVQEVMT